MIEYVLEIHITFIIEVVLYWLRFHPEMGQNAIRILSKAQSLKFCNFMCLVRLSLQQNVYGWMFVAPWSQGVGGRLRAPQSTGEIRLGYMPFLSGTWYVYTIWEYRNVHNFLTLSIRKLNIVFNVIGLCLFFLSGPVKQPLNYKMANSSESDKPKIKGKVCGQCENKAALLVRTLG